MTVAQAVWGWTGTSQMTVARAVGLDRYRSDDGGTGGGVRQVPVRCTGSPHPCCGFGSKDRMHPRHKRSTGRGVGVGAALRVSRPWPPSHSSPGRKGRVPGVTQDLPGAAPFCKSRDRNDRSGDCRKLPPLGSEHAQAAGAPLRGLREPDSLPCAARLALLRAEPSTRDFVWHANSLAPRTGGLPWGSGCRRRVGRAPMSLSSLVTDASPALQS